LADSNSCNVDLAVDLGEVIAVIVQPGRNASAVLILMLTLSLPCMPDISGGGNK